ncbi:MAG: MFS transporter [Burkholderiales bacterium]|jgi:Na+/melibiose symporter-like transporter|nr:MFS transporter [Burkholderiales bacterium]
MTPPHAPEPAALVASGAAAARAAPGGASPAAALGAYSLLAVPLMMTALPLNILLPDFYAARTALSLQTIGLILLATRLVDAVADPLLGSWVDAQKARGAYLRPIVLGVPVLAVAFHLLFRPLQSIGPGEQAAWLFFTLVAAYLGYSLAIVAYQAWGAELAHDDAGRARITGAREGAGLIGVLIGGSLPPLAGYGVASAVLVALLALGLAALVRRAPRPPRSRPLPPGNPYFAFVVPLANANTRWLLGVFALNALAPSITATVFVFFVADRLGLAAYAPAFLAVYFLAGAAGMPLWTRLARRYSLHALWLAGMVIAVAAFVWAYWLPAGALGAFAAICALSGLAFGADLALPPALLARVIDANGHSGQREGAYFGLWNFVNKLVLAVAGALALTLLEALGYARGAQDAAALQALAFTYAVVPCGLKLLAAAWLAVAWRRRHF